MTNKTMKNLQIAWKSIIYADSTGAESSGADDTVRKALFASAAFSISVSKSFGLKAISVYVTQ